MPVPLEVPFRFLADEMIDRKLCNFLRTLGCDVMDCPKGFRNGQVYRLAIKEKRVLLSQDSDFSESKRFPPQPTEGIVYLKISPSTIANLIAQMAKFINETTPADIRGKLATLS